MLSNPLSLLRFTWLSFLGILLFILVLLACLLALLQPALFVKAATGGQTCPATPQPGGAQTNQPALTATSLASTQATATSEAAAGATATATAPEPTITMDFGAGSNGGTTKKSYSGPVNLTIKGSGQAVGKAYSDAFYVYTDQQGKPITPKQTPAFATLCINGGPASKLVQKVPAYSETHTYSVVLNAPNGPLTFGVCDDNLKDNSGSFTITFS